jgi:hypothetical protein
MTMNPFMATGILTPLTPLAAWGLAAVQVGAIRDRDLGQPSEIERW